MESGSEQAPRLRPRATPLCCKAKHLAGTGHTNVPPLHPDIILKRSTGAFWVIRVRTCSQLHVDTHAMGAVVAADFDFGQLIRQKDGTAPAFRAAAYSSPGRHERDTETVSQAARR